MSLSHISDVTILRRRYKLLPESIAPKVEEHLQQCELCRDRAFVLDEAWRAFSEWPPPTLSADVLTVSVSEVAKRPLRRASAPPPRPRGDEATSGASESATEDAPAAPAAPPARTFWYLAAALLALLLGGVVFLWLYAYGRGVGPGLSVIAPNQLVPGVPATVEVELQDEQGAPFPKQPITLELREDKISRSAITKETDAQGRVSLPLTAPGEGAFSILANAGEKWLLLPVSARARGTLHAEVLGATISAGATEELLFRLQEPGSARPLAGAPVRYEIFDPSGVRVLTGEARTSSAGEARVQVPLDLGARAGGWSFHASAAGQSVRGSFEVIPARASGLEISHRARREGELLSVDLLARGARGVVLAAGEATLRYQEQEVRAALVEGAASLSLAVPPGGVAELLVREGAESESVPISARGENLALRFLPDRGLFHAKLPPTGILLVQDSGGRPLSREVEVWSEATLLARAKTAEDGLALVALPPAARGRALTLKAGAEEATVPAPLVSQDPAVRCTRAVATRGESLACEVIHTNPGAVPLMIATEGQLVGVAWVPPGEGVRRVEAALPAAGLTELSTGAPRESSWLVSVEPGPALPLRAADEEGALALQAGGQVALVVGARAPQDPPRLGRADEEEARWLFASFRAAPLQARASSTVVEDQEALQGFRGRLTIVLRWLLGLIAALYVVPALGYALYRTRLFRVVVPTLALAVAILWFVPRLGWQAAVLVVVGGLALGGAWLRGEEAAPSALWLGAGGLFGAAGVLWLWGQVSLQVPPRPLMLPLIEAKGTGSPTPVGLWENALALSTDESGEASVRYPSGTSGLLIEGVAADGARGRAELPARPSSPLSLALSLPEVMVIGDRVLAPYSVENHGDAPLTLAVTAASLDNKLDLADARRVVTVAPWSAARGTLAVEARGPGVSWLALSAETSSGARASATAEVWILAGREPSRAVEAGATEGARALLPPDKFEEPNGALLELFLSLPEALAREDLGPSIGCAEDQAARLGVSSWLAAQLPDPASSQAAASRALQSLAAHELSSGGFSACGGPLDPGTSALALLAMQAADKTSPADPALRTRTRKALAAWLTAHPALTAASALAAFSLAREAEAEPESKRAVASFLGAAGEPPNDRARAALAAALHANGQTERALALAAPLLAAPGDKAAPPADAASLALALLVLPPDDARLPGLRQVLFSLPVLGPQGRLLRAAALLQAPPVDPAKEIEAKVSYGDADPIPLVLSSDDPARALALGAAAAKRPVQLSANGQVWFRLTRSGAPAREEKPAKGAVLPLVVSWPEEVALGAAVSAEVALSSFAGEPVLLAVPVPAALRVDTRGLDALLAAGEIWQASERAGVLWISLPGERAASVRLPFVAERAGKCRAARARVWSLRDESSPLASLPAEIAVRRE